VRHFDYVWVEQILFYKLQSNAALWRQAKIKTSCALATLVAWMEHTALCGTAGTGKFYFGNVSYKAVCTIHATKYFHNVASVHDALLWNYDPVLVNYLAISTPQPRTI
jgi:hypothetical protein